MGEVQEEIGMIQRLERVRHEYDIIRRTNRVEFTLKNYPNLNTEVMGLLNEHFTRQERLDILVKQLVDKLRQEIEQLIWDETNFTKDEAEANKILRHMAMNWRTLEEWSVDKNTSLHMLESWVIKPGERLEELMGKELDLSKAMKRICQYIEATARQIDQDE